MFVQLKVAMTNCCWKIKTNYNISFYVASKVIYRSKKQTQPQNQHEKKRMVGRGGSRKSDYTIKSPPFSSE